MNNLHRYNLLRTKYICKYRVDFHTEVVTLNTEHEFFASKIKNYVIMWLNYVKHGNLSMTDANKCMNDANMS